MTVVSLVLDADAWRSTKRSSQDAMGCEIVPSGTKRGRKAR